MFPSSSHQQSSHQHIHEKPFRMVLEQRNKKLNGSFVPAAHIEISPALRTSGLLKVLPPEDVKSLLVLLTFISPNGDCRAYLHQLTRAMHISQTKARNRMNHLMSVRWQGRSLVYETAHPSGLVSYSLSPEFMEYSHHEELEIPNPSKSKEPKLQELSIPRPSIPAPPNSQASRTQPPMRGGFRDEIIAHSRATYGRPRAEVERIVARQLGHAEPQSEEDRAQLELQRKLENVGVSKDQAQRLLAEYDHEKIVQQLEWLPYRNAKNPAAYLVAAIEKDYAQPLAHRFLGNRPEGHADEPPFVPKIVDSKPSKPKPKK